MNLQELNTELSSIHSKSNKTADDFGLLGEIPFWQIAEQFGFLPPEASDRWKHCAARGNIYSHRTASVL